MGLPVDPDVCNTYAAPPALTWASRCSSAVGSMSDRSDSLAAHATAMSTHTGVASSVPSTTPPARSSCVTRGEATTTLAWVSVSTSVSRPAGNVAFKGTTTQPACMIPRNPATYHTPFSAPKPTASPTLTPMRTSVEARAHTNFNKREYVTWVAPKLCATPACAATLSASATVATATSNGCASAASRNMDSTEAWRAMAASGGLNCAAPLQLATMALC